MATPRFIDWDMPVKLASAHVSSRALESHQRAKHGVRLHIKRFIGSAVCPSCGTDFKDRLRCIRHVSDRRRTKCAEWILENGSQLSEVTLKALDAVDTGLRREAQRAGRTNHIAVAPARNACGKVVGRVS